MPVRFAFCNGLFVSVLATGPHRGKSRELPRSGLPILDIDIYNYYTPTCYRLIKIVYVYMIIIKIPLPFIEIYLLYPYSMPYVIYCHRLYFAKMIKSTENAKVCSIKCLNLCEKVNKSWKRLLV